MEGIQNYGISEGFATRTQHEKKALNFRIIRFMFEAGIKAICYWGSVVCIMYRHLHFTFHPAGRVHKNQNLHFCRDS